jgi:hypothetical protein
LISSEGHTTGRALDDRVAMGNLLGFKYEGVYKVWVPKIGIKDNTFYEDGPPAPAMHDKVFDLTQLKTYFCIPLPLYCKYSNKWIMVIVMISGSLIELIYTKGILREYSQIFP